VDFFSSRENSDYYEYRYSSTYARPEQLLRTVEKNHLVLSQQRMRERDYFRAFNEFAFVLRVFPNHPQALVGFMELCKAWRSPKCNVDEYLAKALAVNPDAAGTHTVQGIYFARTGRYPAAIESYKRALALEPDSSNAHYNLALAYFDTKQYALANEHAQTAYALGFPLPSLRDKLKRAGYWKPAEASRPDPASARAEPAPPAESPPSTPANKD
jgi:tetratricopeptide (TPR) repeat protein